MDPDNFIELEAGVDFWFKSLYFFVAVLAVLALLTANTTGPVKITVLVALILFFSFTRWQMVRQKSIHRLWIYSNGAVTLINSTGQEFPGILESDSWATRWFSIVPVGRFDRWGTQRLLVCASRNNASDYRQLIKRLRLGHVRDGILGPG